MLKSVKISNFKKFSSELLLDFSNTKKYSWNTEYIQNDIVKNAIIYGKTGSGKTSLSNAINIYKVLGSRMYENIKSNLVNLHSTNDKFEIEFIFSYIKDHDVTYSFISNGISFISEKLILGDKVLFDVNFETNKYITNMSEIQTLKFGEDLNVRNILSFIYHNSSLPEDHPIRYVHKFLITTHVSDESNNYVDFIPNIGFNNETTQIQFTKELNKELTKYGFHEKLSYNTEDKQFYIDFPKKKVKFSSIASSGQQILFNYVRDIILSKNTENENHNELILIDNKEYELNIKYRKLHIFDEFSAHYDYNLSEKLLKAIQQLDDRQTIIITHNTNLLTNRLSRPDCIFMLKDSTINNLSSLTNKEIRVGHNLERMFIGGEFGFLDDEEN